MKTVELTQGYVALVDDCEYEKCMVGPKWFACVKRRKDGSIWTVYATRRSRKADGTRIAEYMHCFIMGAKGIDHKDGNGLNNQRYNLRPATTQQNGCSQRLSVANTSGYKGVSWSKRRNKWEANIKVDGKRIHLGFFTDILDARDAADAGRLKYHGQFALTNAMLEERVVA